MTMSQEIDNALEDALSSATPDQLYVTQDALTKLPVVPGSVMDKLRKYLQLLVQHEIDTVFEGKQ